MKTKFILLINILVFTLAYNQLFSQEDKSKEQREKEYQENIKKDSIDGVYIPIDLNDCFKQIDIFWTDSIKNQVKNMTEDEFVGNAHFGFGMWMRNNWQFWSGSRLSKYFNDLGIFHPDDMSSIILTSYHRYLYKKEIKLEEQIKYYQEFWEKNK